MESSDVDYINRSLRTHLSDLHILLTHDQVNIDVPLYNDIVMVLLNAEEGIKKATERHNARILESSNHYGDPKNVVE